ncbi:tumor necrosis factor ligand superfamily member 8 [Sphaerodactylus townsendi]|uniref:tumor necrosis factor ligand superfamily member 8 n=1 Tax=Sphaerodactylus townsendi TaxID=933632 RepID=UPI002025F2E1|nr:tumor necrosis factor ligand superfamily member 8 [Sphaerodactylus townsendi]
MSFKAQQMSFLPVDGPPGVAKDMTDENLTRKIRTPAQTYSNFVIVFLAVCLLVALGAIVVLVLQNMGSCPQHEGHRNLQNNEAATGSSQIMPPQKAAAYLQVLKPINQSQLRWIENGVLYNMKYDNGNLVIQQPGLYFIYCHLHFFITSCPNKTSDLKLDIYVNGKTMKQTLFTLCGCEKTSERTYHDLFQVLLIELEKGHQIAVYVQGFEYVETDGSPSSNVLGAFKYSGEDWGYSLFRTVGQNGL